MLQIIRKYCDNNTLDNGLLLIDSPTGSGKTYNVMQSICDIVCTGSNTKIFYITSLKKNLPKNDLAEMFSKIGKKELFKEKFLYINSNCEQIKNSWSKVVDKIPDKIKEHSTYKNLDFTLQYLKKFPINSNFEINLENQLRIEVEPNFRKYIKSLLKDKFDTPKQRLTAIKNDNNWKWIGILYPAVFTSEKQIFFLSMDKFLYGNSTLIEPTYQFLNHKIIENSIIFIDEFDSSKETILKKIISDNLQNKVDYIHLFNVIYTNLTTRDFPKNILDISKDNMPKVKEIAENIYKQYNMNYFYKTTSNFQSDKNNFLFHDYKHHTIFNANKNNYITLTKDDIEKICWIDTVSKKPSLDEINIFNLLSQIKGFITFFEQAVNIIAHRYQKYKNEQRKSYDVEFTIDEALNSIIALFNIEDDYRNFIINGIYSHTNSKTYSLPTDVDLSFYDKGFRYYDFIDDGNHDLQSKILLSDFSITPEKILLKMCSKAKVIGISATATLNSVICNYDIDYIKYKLKDKYYTIPQEIQLDLQEKFNALNLGYENVIIHTDFISADNYSENSWINLFNNEEIAYSIYNELELTPIDVYIKKRYLKIAKVYKEFILHNDIYSFLCMLNKHPKNNDIKFDKSVLKKIFNYIITDFLGKNSNLSYDNTVLYMQSKDFDIQKKDLNERLSNGEKIFVISVYQTIGVGQNLQYDFKDNSNLIKINDRISSKQKDFDAIYLDKPTNILINLTGDITEENFIKYIYQVESLRYRGEICQYTAINRIRKAFRCFIEKKSLPNDFNISEDLYKCPSTKLAITKIIIQAIGRICRTSYKNPNIYIYADSDLIDILDISTVDKPCNIEYKTLLEKIMTSKNTPLDSNLELLYNKANDTSDVTYKHIMTLLAYKEWTSDKVARWNALRDFVLKYPTVSQQDYKLFSIVYNMYIELPKKSNIYWYSEFDDYKETEVHFDKKYSYDKEVSQNDIKLDVLMELPNLKEYFIENNYATEFTPNDYIMCPVLFNNIYKGALGETVGKFIFERYLGYELYPLSNDIYERFDFYIGNDIYIDFKYWKETFNHENREELINKITEKLKECNGKKLIIANIISNEENNINDIGNLTGRNLEILEIPYLFSSKTKKLNFKSLEKIKEFINGTNI